MADNDKPQIDCSVLDEAIKKAVTHKPKKKPA